MHLVMIVGALAAIAVMSTTREQIAEADARMKRWTHWLWLPTGLLVALLVLGR
jgi:hypothetical protein